MSLPSPEASALSSSQRHCHLLLLLYLPETPVTLESVCAINHVDAFSARQDITEVEAEIQRYHRLSLVEDNQGHFSLSGTELDQRLCLLHWLRRALRVAPDFVEHHFAPAVKQQLKSLALEKALWDDHNLRALVQHCALGLSREFTPRDRQFLHLFMQHALCRRTATEFTDAQRAWLSARIEHRIADEVVRHWQKRCKIAPDNSEIPLFALLFSQLHAPSAAQVRHAYEQQLLDQVNALIADFQSRSGMQFSDQAGLSAQLYTHLSQALERSLFGIGIDNSLKEEVARLYPRLLRTTRAAMAAFEQHYRLTFSEEEMGLVAIIFGAWLMQENTLQEKQVLLLTANDSALEQAVEQQLRELTLLPLNIKYLDVVTFQRQSAPKGIALVITPYATPLPLYSPPLIHAELPLQPHQQLRIKTLLES